LQTNRAYRETQVIKLCHNTAGPVFESKAHPWVVSPDGLLEHKTDCEHCEGTTSPGSHVEMRREVLAMTGSWVCPKGVPEDVSFFAKTKGGMNPEHPTGPMGDLVERIFTCGPYDREADSAHSSGY